MSSTMNAPMTALLRAHIGTYASLQTHEQHTFDELLQAAMTGTPIAFTRSAKYGGWSPYALLATHGHTWEESSLPARYKRGIPKNCYQNCWEKARRSTNLLYCEGMAMSADLGLPMAHAWLLDTTTGAIIEPTWDTQRCTHAYLGFVFPDEIVREARRLSGRNSIAIIEGDWARQGWFLSHAAEEVVAFTQAITAQAPSR